MDQNANASNAPESPSAFSLLQRIGNLKPYLGFKQLSIGNHEIVKFRVVTNKQYREGAPDTTKKALLVELEDQVLFLPHYFFEEVECDEEKVYELNKDGVKKYLFFGGERENK